MAQILQFIRQNDAFDPETTALLGAVYDSAIAKINGQAELEVVGELVARRIITMASIGERDPERLRKAAAVAIEHHAHSLDAL